MGWLADRWSKKHVMLLVYAIVAATIPCSCVFAPSAAPDQGGRLPLRDRPRRRLHDHPAHGRRAVRRAHARARVMGIVLTADGVAEAVVPLAVATIRDRTASYAGGFLLLVASGRGGRRSRSALLPRRAEPADLTGLPAAATR